MRKTKFYSENGWAGTNQRSSIRPKQIADTFRAYARQELQGYKLSVRSTHNSIDVAIIEAPEEILTNAECTYLQVGEWGIQENESLTESGKEVMTKIASFIQSYNYDDSDAGIDYFDTGFYLHLGIGKWNRPLKIK